MYFVLIIDSSVKLTWVTNSSALLFLIYVYKYVHVSSKM